MSEPQSALRLQAKLQDRSASVLVVGLGAVGLALVNVLLEAGYSVIGADTRAEWIATLLAGESPMAHIPASWCAKMASDPRLRFEAIFKGEALRSSLAPLPSIGVLCVPTPLDAERRPDLLPLRLAAQTLTRSLAKECLVLLESTTYPGTTRGLLAPMFADQGFALGSEAFLAFAPERVNPGHGDPAARHAPRLVGGLDAAGTELARRFYTTLGYSVVTTARAEIAEAAKLVENVYRAVNISLANELKLSFAAQGIDIWEVLDAAQTKGFGFQRFDPGPGAGGSCIPVDPRYLEYFARQGGVPLRLVEIAGEIDANMTEHVVEVLTEAARTAGKTLAGLKVLLLGVAYKPDVNITSESPSLRIAARLCERGALVEYADPLVPGPLVLAPGLTRSAQKADAATFARFDALVYLTDHQAFPLAEIANFEGLLIDTRGKRALQNGRASYISA